MPKTYQSRLDRIFAVLSDPTRRSILEKLKDKEYSLLELSEHYDMSFQAISKHLGLIEQAELLNRRREGRNQFYGHNPEPLEEAISWISKNHTLWKQSFDNLKILLDRMKDK